MARYVSSQCFLRWLRNNFSNSLACLRCCWHDLDNEKLIETCVDQLRVTVTRNSWHWTSSATPSVLLVSFGLSSTITSVFKYAWYRRGMLIGSQYQVAVFLEASLLRCLSHQLFVCWWMPPEQVSCWRRSAYSDKMRSSTAIADKTFLCKQLKWQELAFYPVYLRFSCRSLVVY